MAAYQRGQSVQLGATFTDSAGAAANPTTVTCKVQKPDLTETTYTSISTPAVANPSTGTFRLILPATTSGQWAYRWEGTTGAAIAVDEGQFSVLLSEF
jgi:hypothetical protein